MRRECPHCGRTNEIHDGPRPGMVPKPGDVSLCWKCGGLSFFTEDDGMRKPAEEEEKALLSNPQVRAAQAAVRATQAVELRRGR